MPTVLLLTTIAGAVLGGCLMVKFQVANVLWLGRPVRDGGFWLTVLMLPVFFLAGLAADSFGGRETLVFGALLAAISMMSLSYPDGGMRTLLTVLRPVAEACVLTGCTVLMPEAFNADNPAASLNLGMLFISLGGLAGTAFARIRVPGLNERRRSILLALACTVPAILASLCAEPQRLTGNPSRDQSFTLIITGALAMLSAYPLEGLLGGTSNDLRPNSIRPVAYWCGLIASRLLVAAFCDWGLVPRGAENWLLVLLLVGASILLGNLASARLTVTTPAYLVAAMMIGPICPLILAILFDGVDPGHRGLAYATVTIAGGIATIGASRLIAMKPSRLPDTPRYMLWLSLAATGAALALVLLP